MEELVTVPHYHYLLHPYNATLVTSCDAKGKANIIAIAWLVPLSVDPPLVGMSIRLSRYSYDLLRKTGEFVVNVAPYRLAKEVLICGRRSGRKLDKFAATGLTTGKARRVQPPIIKECVGYLECRVLKDIEAGDHRLVIGEVLEAYARPEAVDQEGLRNLGHVLLHVGKNRFTTTIGDVTEPPL